MDRIDMLLVKKNFFSTRQKAKNAIVDGVVYIDGKEVKKPSQKVSDDEIIEIKGKIMPYVSRGGLKLEKAIDEFNLDLKNRIVIDIGASTGGFTDCALKNGAQLSYAIDVGTNQLNDKLRNDKRVIVMEKTNFRYVTLDDLSLNRPNFACIDVSFISLRHILPVLKQIICEKCDIIALIKPQFEAGKKYLNKKGIIKDKKIHERVLVDFISFVKNLDFCINNLTFSPITGGEGNIEFLIHLSFDDKNDISKNLNIKDIINEAHNNLK